MKPLLFANVKYGTGGHCIKWNQPNRERQILLFPSHGTHTHTYIYSIRSVNAILFGI